MISTARVLKPWELNHCARASSDLVNGIFPTNSLVKSHLQGFNSILTCDPRKSSVVRQFVGLKGLHDFEQRRLFEPWKHFRDFLGTHMAGKNLRKNSSKICCQFE